MTLHTSESQSALEQLLEENIHFTQKPDSTQRQRRTSSSEVENQSDILDLTLNPISKPKIEYQTIIRSQLANQLEKIGTGANEQNYRLLIDGKQYFLKIMAQNAKREIRANQLAQETGASPKIHYAKVSGEDQGYILTELIETTPNPLHKKSTDLPVKLSYIEQTALALLKIQQKGIIHHDIKPQNVLLTKEDKQVTIIDYGSADIINNQKNNQTRQYIDLADQKDSKGKKIAEGKREEHNWVTATYAAPEIINNHKSPKTDVFAIGTMFAYAMLGEHPHSTLRILENGPNGMISRGKTIDEATKDPQSRMAYVRDHLQELIPQLEEKFSREGKAHNYWIPKLLEEETIQQLEHTLINLEKYLETNTLEMSIPGEEIRVHKANDTLLKTVDNTYRKLAEAKKLREQINFETAQNQVKTYAQNLENLFLKSYTVAKSALESIERRDNMTEWTQRIVGTEQINQELNPETNKLPNYGTGAFTIARRKLQESYDAMGDDLCELINTLNTAREEIDNLGRTITKLHNQKYVNNNRPQENSTKTIKIEEFQKARTEPANIIQGNYFQKTNSEQDQTRPYNTQQPIRELMHAKSLNNIVTIPLLEPVDEQYNNETVKYA